MKADIVVVLVISLACTALSQPVGSQPTGPKPARVTQSVPAPGITRVILRAANADQAKVLTSKTDTAITVSGIPEGGSKGYQSPDPKWKETPPGEWGLAFKSKTYGNTLVISTFNEIAYIHHHYDLSNIELSTPAGVSVIKQTRTLSDKGAADLTEPATN